MAKINEITKEQIECIKILAWLTQFWAKGLKDSKHWNQLNATNLLNSEDLKEFEILILSYLDKEPSLFSKVEDRLLSRKQFEKLVNYIIDHLGIPYRISGQDEVKIARKLNERLGRKNANYKNICIDIIKNKFFKKYNK